MRFEGMRWWRRAGGDWVAVECVAECCGGAGWHYPDTFGGPSRPAECTARWAEDSLGKNYPGYKLAHSLRDRDNLHRL